ncbi:MAG: response regulator [Leptospiraceae bacterium]|nr:response regulator [Leptospiraceae bacterium]
MTRPIVSAVIIDDDPVNNLICERVLQCGNFARQIIIHTEVKTALEFFATPQEKESATSQVIFLDLNMPVLNGWDFLREYDQKELHRANRKLYILSSSIYSADLDRARAHPLVNGYISKPLDPGHLSSIAAGSQDFFIKMR